MNCIKKRYSNNTWSCSDITADDFVAASVTEVINSSGILSGVDVMHLGLFTLSSGVLSSVGLCNSL